VLAFLLTALVVELTPGPNMATLASLTLQRGRIAGLAAVAGVGLGLAIVGGFAALGLSAVIAESAFLYQTLRWGGVAYLLYLAYDAWRDASAPPEPDVELGGLRRLFLTGLTVNLLNPKAMVFYVAVLPTFVVPENGSLVQQSLALAAVYVAVATAVHVVIVLLASRLRPYLIAGKAERTVRRGLAALMAVIALWFAYETR
jgi:threonine/homoserine/homoserine lactone efflux protein